MTAALIFGQNVHLCSELVMTLYRAGFYQNLTTLDLSSLNTTQQSADVITSLSLVQKLTEHFNTGNNGLSGLFLDTNDLNFVIQMKCTTLYTAGSNGTTTSNGKYILNWHQKRLVGLTLWIWNPRVNCIHQFQNLVAPLAGRIFQSLQSRTLNNRSVISRELILIQQLTNLHVNQL